MKLGINLLKQNQNRKGSNTIYEKEKNKNRSKRMYKKMGQAIARPSPLLSPPMVAGDRGTVPHHNPSGEPYSTCQGCLDDYALLYALLHCVPSKFKKTSESVEALVIHSYVKTFCQH